MLTVAQGLPLHPPWKELVRRACQWEYGSLHSHHEIAEILQIKYPSRAYYSCLRRARDVLLCEHQRCLVPIPKFGYRVLRPEEHVRESLRQVRLAQGRLNRGYEIAFCTNTAMLSPEARQTWENYTSRILGMRYQLTQGWDELRQLAGGGIIIPLNTDRQRVLPQPQ